MVLICLYSVYIHFPAWCQTDQSSVSLRKEGRGHERLRYGIKVLNRVMI